jgi:hypothetical protein
VRHAGTPTAPVASADRSDGGTVAPRDPPRPCWQVLASWQRVRRRPGGPSLAPRAEFFTVSEAHEVAVPCGLKVFRPPNRISNPARRGSELPME